MTHQAIPPADEAPAPANTGLGGETAASAVTRLVGLLSGGAP